MLSRLTAYFSTEIGQQQNNMRRFYKEASIQPNTNKKHPHHNYLLLLDGKTVKTPYHNPLAFPSQPLAFLVANQFNRQHKFLKTGQMPLLALTRTAVDADIQGHLAEHLRFSIYQYLKTDTLLFVDHHYTKDHKLLAAPLIEFFGKRFGINLKPSASIEAPAVEINKNFVEWVEGLSNWQLIGLETMTIWMKSTVAAFAMAESEFQPIKIQQAAYLEQYAQMRSSGEVEEKLMDINQIKLMASCGQMMYKLSASDYKAD